jgi:POT family proton-dependent oligopeptide transporter
VAAPLTFRFNTRVKFERRNRNASDTIPAGRSEAPCVAVSRNEWECDVSVSERWQEIRTGFERPFWVANITELFERLSYYGVQAVLAIYLYKSLGFTPAQAGDLIGFFGATVWFLPIIGGALADWLGFKRSLAFAYLVLAIGYFLLGSLSAPFMAPMRHLMTLPHLLVLVLLIPALGPAIVKPCVVGTTARSAKENVRSIGYSIYYTLVNVGGALGPLLASFIGPRYGEANVFRVSSIFVFLMFLVVLFFFKEPGQASGAKSSSIGDVARNFLTVISNLRFMIFLVIFSGFYIVFWQIYIALPLYFSSFVPGNVNVARILSTEGFAVIALQVIVAYVTRKIPTFPAMTLGIFITGASWFILAFHTTAWTAVLMLIVLALGEMIQASRYYEYISRLAPEGQQGTYMGFAFLPIAIGFLVAGVIGGRMVHYFGETMQSPRTVWLVIAGIGIATSALMIVFNALVSPIQKAKPTSS